MSEPCNTCEFMLRCQELGFTLNAEDQDECEHFYGFSEEEEEKQDV